MSESDLIFKEVYDRVSWGAMTLICFYVAKQIKDMAESVQELNKNFAVLVERVSNQQGQLNNHDARITTLEVDAR